MTEDRPDFFTLLGLDPDAPWDEQAYQRALAQARNQWSMAATGPRMSPSTIAARRNQQFYATRAIQEVMEDETRREAERRRAKGSRKAELAAKGKEFQARLQLLAKRGHLLPPEAESLRREYADVLASDRDLAGRLDATPVGPVQDDLSAARLDASTAARLRDMLDSARLHSLYDALKTVAPTVTPRSPRKLLLEAADELYRTEHRRKNKSDPAIKARELLSGLAKTLFATDEQRERHDTSMRLTTLDELIAWVVKVLAAAKAISGEQVLAFLEEARRRGIDDLDLALRHLRETFRQRGWALELPAAEAEDTLRHQVQCPRCTMLNGPLAEICVMCAFGLREPCPACGAVDPRYGGCACGFPIGQRDTVRDLITQAIEALEAGRMPIAESLLDRAEGIWRLPPGRDDPVSAMIEKARSRWKSAAEQVDQIRATITDLMNARKHIQAADLLRTAPPGFPESTALLERAEAMIGQARELYDRSRQSRTSTTRRVELLTEALRRCADLEVAKAELERIPPERPRDVRATVPDPSAGVLVSWSGGTDPGVSYVVVRRTGTDAPESAGSLPGQRRLGETTDSSWHDGTAGEAAGLPLTYAVIAARAGTQSAPGVAEPVVVLPDPDLNCQSGHRQVKLTWTPPERAERVEISRRVVGGSGAPVVLPVTREPQLLDQEVVNGVRYQYTARASYSVPGMGTRWSAGLVRQATPYEPLAPPGPLVLTSSSAQYNLYKLKVEIRYPPPERGEVLIVRQDGSGSLREGDQGREGVLKVDGDVRPEPPPVSDILFDTELGCFSYVPVLRADGMLYVGRPRRFAVHEEVSELQGEFEDGILRLAWTWAHGGTRALVGHHPTAELLDPTTAALPLSVTREPGEDVGGCSITVGPDDTAAHVVVAVVVERDGTDFVTAGVRRHLVRPPVRVEYQVLGADARRPQLMLRTAARVRLPAIALYGRRERPPRTREDGIRCALVVPLTVSGTRVVPLPRFADRRLRYRLFTASSGEASAVELVPL
ncbi:hypothetical protein ACIBKY_34685 [Nonomuraea sp. NPDC050394]|uniref:hypothetical protein n=1 Tax=Nonomuraea sp. NPDC050394 TaxID=3364363 RepID=UPI0037BCFF96